MAKGKPGADSSVIVTSKIQGKTLVELASELYGGMPLIWGRYITSASTTGDVEYRHLKENQILRDNQIRVLPIARQSKHVSGSGSLGRSDATLNVEDLILTFGQDYLVSQGGKFLLVLDVEGAPSMSVQYYTGWASTVISHSQKFSGGNVTILPCIYATQGDDNTWNSLAAACDAGVECHGAFIARWVVRGGGCLPEFDEAAVMPRVSLPCKVLMWQYSDDCYGNGGFDCSETNPTIDLEQDLLQKCVLPPDMNGVV